METFLLYISPPPPLKIAYNGGKGALSVSLQSTGLDVLFYIQHR